MVCDLNRDLKMMLYTSLNLLDLVFNFDPFAAS